MPTAVASRRSATPKSQSPERERLAALIEEMEFGLIEDLLIVDGRPQFTPTPSCTRVFNLDADDAPHRERSGREYRLRTMAALFRRLALVHGTAVVSIVVKHGLPVRLSVREPIKAR